MPQPLSPAPDNNDDLAQTLEAAIAPRTVWAIFGDSFRMYKAQFVQFHRPLLLPVGMKLLGAALSLILPTYIMTHQMAWLQTLRLPVQIFTVFALSAPGLFLFCRGFWLYVVYMTSMSRNTAEVLADEEPDFKTAFHETPVKEYSVLLLWLLSIWIPSIVITFMGVLISQGIADGLQRLLAVGGTLFLSFLTSVLAGVAAVYLSLAFQVFSLEPDQQTEGLGLLKRSFHLVKGHFWRTLLILVVMGILTGTIVPFIIMLLFDLFHITHIFMPIAEWYTGFYLPLLFKDLEPLLGLFHMTVAEQVQQTSREIIHMFIQTATTLLMLPLGTFAHTMLYLDIRSQAAATTNPEPDQ